MSGNTGAYTGASSITYTTGMVLGTTVGSSPAPTPKELLIATRAIESKGGWLGQIVMAGEIVYETKPQPTSRDALGKVNRRIHKQFKRLIVGP